jgi:hypothetical protein
LPLLKGKAPVSIKIAPEARPFLVRRVMQVALRREISDNGGFGWGCVASATVVY